MELHFAMMLCSNMGNENLMWALLNVHAERIWPAYSRFPTLHLKHPILLKRGWWCRAILIFCFLVVRCIQTFLSFAPIFCIEKS